MKPSTTWFYCCDEFKIAMAGLHNNEDIIAKDEDGYYIHDYDWEYNDYDDICSIYFCPFCGRKLSTL